MITVFLMWHLSDNNDINVDNRRTLGTIAFLQIRRCNSHQTSSANQTTLQQYTDCICQNVTPEPTSSSPICKLPCVETRHKEKTPRISPMAFSLTQVTCYGLVLLICRKVSNWCFLCFGDGKWRWADDCCLSANRKKGFESGELVWLVGCVRFGGRDQHADSECDGKRH